jgi:hypothetical protein
VIRVRLARRVAAGVLMGVAAAPALAGDPLWLMSAREWQASSAPERRELVRDYMRSFCARPTMELGGVIRCIERGSRRLAAGDAMFDVASACVLAAS